MSWKRVKLGDVIKQRRDLIIIDNSVEYKRCRVQVNRKGVILRDIVKGIAINTKKQQVCKEGDFLVAEIDAKVGGYGFVGKDLEGAIVSSHYFLFEVDETKLLKKYLSWLIKTDIIQEQITSKGSTNYAAIRPSHVLNFEIPLPSISEQIEIVSRLNNINTRYSLLFKELDQQQTYLQQLRQTILQEAVQGKLSEQNPSDEDAATLLKRIKAEKGKLIKEGKLKKEKELPSRPGDEIPFVLPKGWVWCRLAEAVY
jgi:type I restriction enzyme S subunit